MGASESSARSNGTNDEEENNNNGSSGTSIGAAAAAVTAAAGVAVVAFSLSKMLSDNTETQERSPCPSVDNSSRIISYEATGSYDGIKINQRSIWSPPPRGRYKMNTDGGCRPTHDGDVQRGPSGYGGILRDHNGDWVRGFIGFIGVSDCLTSEFHGILKGLELLDQLKIEGAILETDCQAAYEWVTRQKDNRGKSEILDACWSVIVKCRQLIDKNDVVVSLVQGENANQCADKLADMAIDRRSAYVEIKKLPWEMKHLVEKDAQVING